VSTVQFADEQILTMFLPSNPQNDRIFRNKGRSNVPLHTIISVQLLTDGVSLSAS